MKLPTKLHNHHLKVFFASGLLSLATLGTVTWFMHALPSFGYVSNPTSNTAQINKLSSSNGKMTQKPVALADGWTKYTEGNQRLGVVLEVELPKDFSLSSNETGFLIENLGASGESWQYLTSLSHNGNNFEGSSPIAWYEQQFKVEVLRSVKRTLKNQSYWEMTVKDGLVTERRYLIEKDDVAQVLEPVSPARDILQVKANIERVIMTLSVAVW